MTKNKVQCPYGHFYNADRFEDCPVCSPNVITEPGPHPDEVQPLEGSSTAPEDDAASEYINGQTEGSDLGSMKSVFGDWYAPEKIDEKQPGEESKPDGVAEKPLSSPLKVAVAEVSTHKGKEDVKTVAMWSNPSEGEPIVGWLVCVKGEYFGRSFALETGNNYIGRAADMDIQLAQEESVSRNKHCQITFEPNNQVFYIQQGEGKGLTYLNDDLVLTPTKMMPRDILTIGKAWFILIPLCADGFRWDDYKNE